MAPRKTSQAWTHFSRIEGTPDSAKCNICGNVYKRGGGTKNLLDHLQRFHRELLLNEVIEGDVHVQAYYEDNNAKKKALDRALLKMFARDFQPFSIVDDDGFVEFVRTLDPRYKLPCRQNISKNLIPQMYETVKQTVKTDLLGVRRVALTLDLWSSSRQDAFLGITVHYVKGEKLKSACLDCAELPGSHTAENIRNKVQEIIDEWHLNSKVTAVVTDNGANVVAAVKLLRLRHLACAAHTLNLVVKDAVNKSDDVRSLLQRCAAIVTYFKKSNIAADKLKSKCSAANRSCSTLVQEVDTRWNSKLAMIRRFLELREEILVCLSELPEAPQGLDGTDWEMLRQIEFLLGPFDEITTTLSGETYVTASLIIPLAHGLLRRLDEINTLDLQFQVREFYNNLRKFTVDRMISYEQRSVARGATFLNPQFKKAAFISETRAEEARTQIEGEVRTELQRTAPTQANHQTPSPYVGLLSFLNQRNHQDERSRNSTASTVDAAILVRQYVEVHTVEQDPIKYWNNVDLQQKALADVAAYYNCVPATSVPTERLFSKAGYIINNRRSSLSPSIARLLVFLHGNRAFF